MIKEIIFYFLLIFGFFSLVEAVISFLFSRGHTNDVYLVTFYNKKEDRERIAYLSGKYAFTIYVISPAFAGTEDEYYITDRYYNVKFIKNCEDILK